MSDDHFHLRLCLTAVAEQLEILDPRECRYTLCRPEDLRADLKMLRGRAVELADAPPVSDSYRFPDRTLINDLLVFNRQYRTYWENQLLFETRDPTPINEAIKETDLLYKIYDTVRDCQVQYYYLSCRREALRRLRELIGDAAYYAGELPPHVPIWRYRRID